MVKFIKEVEFPGGSVYYYEINGAEFRFDFKVKIEETVFPGKQFVYGIKKAGK
jgi:hypothetical protein